MDFHQVRIFLAVARELHFGRAAELLHMAQPPVSRSIRQFERELGVRLFERNTRRVELTPVGQALVEPAQAAIDALERVRTVALAAGIGEIGSVRLAYAGATSNVMVGRLARAIKEDYPGIKLELLSGHFAQPAMQSLARGDLDLALGRWDYVPDTVQTRIVAVEELVMAVPVTHRLAQQERVSLRDFEGEPFVSLPPQSGSILNERLQQMTRNSGFSVDIVQDASESWTVMSLVSAGVGVSLTLSSLVDSIADPGVRFLPLSDPIPLVELRIAWRSDSDDRALHSVLRLSESILPTPSSE